MSRFATKEVAIFQMRKTSSALSLVLLEIAAVFYFGLLVIILASIYVFVYGMV